MDLAMDVPDSPALIPGANTSPQDQAELIAQVERAIYQLYQDPDPANKTQADQWLQTLQASPPAWNISWLLLQHQSLEIQNYGALMLHSKITKSWSELPREQYDILKLELFKAIAQFSSGPKLVLIQLCRCLVGVAFNTMPELWPNAVVSCIHNLRQTTQSTQNANFATAIVQLLTIFPEEFDRTSTSSSAMKRGLLRRELSQGLQSVLMILEEILSTGQDSRIKSDAMKCCYSWVQFGLPLPEITSLIDRVFQCLLDPELLEIATDTLTEMLSHDDSFKYPSSLMDFLQRVLQLRDFVRTKLEENDKEECLCLSKLVTETAMSNLNALVSITSNSSEENCDDSLDIVQLILEFTCVPGCYPVDEQCSLVTLRFWEYFLDQIASSEPDQCKFLRDFYDSSITSLIEVFPDKCQYPVETEWTENWSEDDQDDFIKYREDLCDLAESLQRTMHIEYLQHLSTLMTTLLRGSHAPTWQSVEAVLFLLQGVASNATQQSSPPLQNILSLFPNMPPHPTLVKTALKLLGCLSNWFKLHEDLLQAVLPMILRGLSQPDLAPSAALAFKDVCAECHELLGPVAVQLVPACKAGLSNPQLEPRDCVRLIAAIGSVLSSMSLSDLIGPLESLVSSRVDVIQALAMEEASEGTKPQVEKELAVLSALCHHIYPTLKEGEQHPVVLLLNQLFPSVQALVTKWCTDQDVVESICSCINRAVRTVHEQYAPLLERTVELIVKCFAAVHHAKLLNSAAQIVEVFGKESSCSSLISALLQQLHSSSLQVFQTAMCDHPDTVQAYLGLMSAALKNCPLILLGMEHCANNLFDIGLAALELPENPTVKAAAGFFVTFISLTGSVESVQEVLRLNGLTLMQCILKAIAWAAPRSYLGSYTDVLAALNVHCLPLCSQWLEELLSQDGFPTSHVTSIEKQSFKSAVLRGQGNQQLLSTKVKEFALMCRGFHGTLYAIETS